MLLLCYCCRWNNHAKLLCANQRCPAQAAGAAEIWGLIAMKALAQYSPGTSNTALPRSLTRRSSTLASMLSWFCPTYGSLLSLYASAVPACCCSCCCCPIVRSWCSCWSCWCSPDPTNGVFWVLLLQHDPHLILLQRMHILCILLASDLAATILRLNYQWFCCHCSPPWEYCCNVTVRLLPPLLCLDPKPPTCPTLVAEHRMQLRSCQAEAADPDLAHATQRS